MIEKKIANWLRNRLEAIPSAGRFELTHQADMGEETTTLLRLEPGSGDGEAHSRARELSEQIVEAATEHANAYEGKQRYRVLALEAETFEELGVYVFALGLGGGIARSEPGEPTERGLLAQLMRHNQHLAQINVEQSQAVNQALIAENRDLRGRVQQVEAQRAEWFELLETMHSARHQRELEMMAEAGRKENRDKAIRLLMQYVPELVKKIDLGALGVGNANVKLPAPKPDPLADAHEKMRRVWRLLDRDWIAGRLDEENRARVDALLGIGDKLETVEDFATKLGVLWASLDEDVTDEIQKTILAHDAPLALELTQLMQRDEEEAAE